MVDFYSLFPSIQPPKGEPEDDITTPLPKEQSYYTVEKPG